MNNKKVTLEQLALYQDHLLSDIELREVEAALAENSEYRALLEELKVTESVLQEWGRKNRIFNAVTADLKKDPMQQSSSAFSLSPRERRRLRVVLRRNQAQQSSWAFSLSPQWAVSFAAMAALVWSVYFAYPFFTTNFASVLVASGDVRQMSALIEDGAALSIGRQIELGSDGYARILMADGRSEAEFGPNTIAVITGERQLSVTKGVVYNKVAKDPNHKYEITTPHGTVVVLGTQFEVEVNENESTIRVKEGAVRIQSTVVESATAVVNKGFTGSITRNAIVPPRRLAGTPIAPWSKAFTPSISTKDMAKINDLMTGQNR